MFTVQFSENIVTTSLICNDEDKLSKQLQLSSLNVTDDKKTDRPRYKQTGKIPNVKLHIYILLFFDILLAIQIIYIICFNLYVLNNIK